jgi:hypothetical protein
VEPEKRNEEALNVSASAGGMGESADDEPRPAAMPDATLRPSIIVISARREETRIGRINLARERKGA